MMDHSVSQSAAEPQERKGESYAVIFYVHNTRAGVVTANRPVEPSAAVQNQSRVNCNESTDLESFDWLTSD